jgi:catalase
LFQEEIKVAKKRTSRDKTQLDTDDRKTARYADQNITTGTGGETHQTANGDRPVLTTQQGVPVSDDQNSLKIGDRGPTALQDFHFREKIFHFDHERLHSR